MTGKNNHSDKPLEERYEILKKEIERQGAITTKMHNRVKDLNKLISFIHVKLFHSAINIRGRNGEQLIKYFERRLEKL